VKRKSFVAGLLGAAGAVLTARAVRQRLRLSRAKHRSLAGHARMAKRAASLMPAYTLDGDAFFAADSAPEAVAQQREAAFERLAALYRQRFAKSAAESARMRDAIPDIDFTGRYRVPFQFSAGVREALSSGNFYKASNGVMLTDLDDNQLHDLTGSYGVNLLGIDTYRALIDEGAQSARELGPSLAGLHPLVADNVERLKAISGLDAVSFHMSGTEAVMQAVRLARYHTGKAKLVRFAGAYHGWWGDVQPGVGNPVPADNTYTLADMSERALGVIASRRDIACVLVNPLQALHPNANAPGDSTLVAGRKPGRIANAAYGDWLRRLAETCHKAGVVLIMDEVFTGFRLAPRGACEYFGGIEPDMITYGKTLGGGLPVGVLCGRAGLMRRYKPDRPADICFARGTFNSHPYVMGAMDAFLRHMERPEAAALYDGMDATWNARADALSARLAALGAPARVANLGTIWTVWFDRPSRYHWMYQFYLRAHGLALSWVGTGRLIFSLAYGESEFEAVADRMLAAAQQMLDDGWWWQDDSASAQPIGRALVREVLAHRFG
jgi:glutamate-1-semialdehyde 2,1-aminomutase